MIIRIKNFAFLCNINIAEVWEMRYWRKTCNKLYQIAKKRFPRREKEKKFPQCNSRQSRRTRSQNLFRRQISIVQYVSSLVFYYEFIMSILYVVIRNDHYTVTSDRVLHFCYAKMQWNDFLSL